MPSSPEPPIDYALIGANLAGEATPAQVAALAAWLAEDPAHEALYAELKALWTAPAAPVPAFDTEAALDRLHGRLPPPPAAGRPPARLWAGLAVAASILLVLLGTWWLWPVASPPPVWTQIAQVGEGPQMLTLPDGSRLLLNQGATLAYHFTPDIRQLRLTGEAYFDVAPESQRPFEVVAGAASIRVLGTAFVVRVSSEAVRAEVQEGRVVMSNLAGDSLHLRPQQAAQLDSGGLRRRPAHLATALAWATGELVFHDQPLDLIVAKLGHWYGQEIRLARPALGRCRLTGNFAGQPLAEALDLLQLALDLRIARQGTAIVLDGTPCPSSPAR